jgi:hypothetical protein
MINGREDSRRCQKMMNQGEEDRIRQKMMNHGEDGAICQKMMNQGEDGGICQKMMNQGEYGRRCPGMMSVHDRIGRMLMIGGEIIQHQTATMLIQSMTPQTRSKEVPEMAAGTTIPLRNTVPTLK